jgi:hypothetical protein
MRKALTLYTRYLGIWGWILIGLDLFTALGAFEFYTKIPVLKNLPTWGWLIILVIGLLIAPFFAFHKLRLKSEEIKLELEKQKNQRPKIETGIKSQIRDFDIEIANIGEEAEFEAQVEVIDGEIYAPLLPHNYTACWERTRNGKTEIKNGQKDWLKIASLDIDPKGTFFKYHLYYFMLPHTGVLSADSTAWIPGNTEVVRPVIRFKVTIGSKPKMTEGAIVKYYELSEKGLVEK